MKRILVTGANGQLGLTFQDIYQNYTDLYFVFKSRKELDITDFKNIEEEFKIGNYDYIINCAAYTNVEQAEKTPEIAYKVNRDGVRNLALACKEFDVNLIHISTDYVFDGEKEEPYTVNDIPNPINEYGKSKWEGEKYIQEILSSYFIIRTSWLYSKVHGKNFYKTILEKAKKGDDLHIIDEQIGCPTNTNTLAKYLIELILRQSKGYGMHHFTDEKAMTWYDFADKILKENKINSITKLVRDNNYCSFARRPINSTLE